MKSVDARSVVYLRGSHKNIRRTIYQNDNGKLFVKFYGQMIEVRKGTYGYVTVDEY